MILFHENWKQEVRDYLHPFFLRAPSFDDDPERKECNIYRIETINKHESTENLNGRWGEFKLGDARIHYLGTPQYGSEEMAGITWASKANFASPLHFWATAVLVSNAFDQELTEDSNESWLCFEISPTSGEQSSHEWNIADYVKYYWPKDWHPMAGYSSYLPNLTELARHDWANSQPALPQVVYEKEIDNYGFNSNWNNLSVLFENEKHFILWFWQTFG